MADPTEETILATIKRMLGLPEDPDPFDTELTVFIDGAVSDLTQLGVGPIEGLNIDADTKWSALLQNNKRLNNAKTYIFMKVKMVFDSASMTQPLIASYEKMIEETAWRLRIAADPLTPPNDIRGKIEDGATIE
jgi:hypothetical protein